MEFPMSILEQRERGFDGDKSTFAIVGNVIL
jgi:hypothetical protein